MTQRLDHINVNAVNSSAPLQCEICGFVVRMTLNCQVGSHFSQDSSEVNYVQNHNPRPAMTLTLVLTIRVGGMIRISHIGLIQILQICLR